MDVKTRLRILTMKRFLEDMWWYFVVITAVLLTLDPWLISVLPKLTYISFLACLPTHGHFLAFTLHLLLNFFSKNQTKKTAKFFMCRNDTLRNLLFYALIIKQPTILKTEFKIRCLIARYWLPPVEYCPAYVLIRIMSHTFL
jgi:hypothetical protein